MSVDQLTARPPRPAPDTDRPVEAVPGDDGSSQTIDGELPRVVILTSGETDTVEALLVSVARGDDDAFVALQKRMTGLVLVNVRRVLRDATRSETVTQETFAEILQDAIHFDPHRDCGETWLLMRAHQHAMDRLRSLDPARDPHEPTPGPAALVSLS